jgi:hypothetical protein
MCLLKGIKTGPQTAGSRLSLQWPPSVILNGREHNLWENGSILSTGQKAMEASAELVAITISWTLIDSSASCERQISSCFSSCQHEEKRAVSVGMLFWHIGDGQSVEVQQQIVSVVSSRPNPSKVIETFWLHLRTSHLGMKFFEDLNLLGCDTVWVCEWLLAFVMIVVPSPTSVTVKDDCLILNMKALWFLSRSGTTHTAT